MGSQVSFSVFLCGSPPASVSFPYLIRTKPSCPQTEHSEPSHSEPLGSDELPSGLPNPLQPTPVCHANIFTIYMYRSRQRLRTPNLATSSLTSACSLQPLLLPLSPHCPNVPSLSTSEEQRSIACTNLPLSAGGPSGLLPTGAHRIGSIPLPRELSSALEEQHVWVPWRPFFSHLSTPISFIALRHWDACFLLCCDAAGFHPGVYLSGYLLLYACTWRTERWPTSI